MILSGEDASGAQASLNAYRLGSGLLVARAHQFHRVTPPPAVRASFPFRRGKAAASRPLAVEPAH